MLLKFASSPSNDTSTFELGLDMDEYKILRNMSYIRKYRNFNFLMRQYTLELTLLTYRFVFSEILIPRYNLCFRPDMVFWKIVIPTSILYQI